MAKRQYTSGYTGATLLAVSLSALIVGACGGWLVGHGIGKSTAEAMPPAASTAPAGTSGTAPVQTPHLGDTVTLTGPAGENLAATLVKVVDPATPSGTAPGSGKRFVGAQLRLVNNGTAAWNGNGAPTTFSHAIDGQGQQFGPVLATTNAGQMFTAHVVIPPGGTTLGAITFEVPIESKVTAVQIVLDNGQGPSAQWQIG